MHSILKVLALSYKNTPLEIRELLAFNENDSKSFLRNVKSMLGIQEAMVVSTCNRTEIYYASQQDLSSDLVKIMKIEKGIATSENLANYFESIVDSMEAARHLFRVSLGLEAQVIGDIQIGNQVKNAYQWSADEAMAGPFLHRLMHSIFFSNKKVVQQTSFRDGAASVSYVAVDYIKDLVNNFEDPKVLVIGLGEIGEDVVRNLGDHFKGEVCLTNRTQAKANDLAAEYGFKTIPFESFPEEIEKYDAIVSSIRADQTIIDKELLSEVSILRHKFFFDLSVPRSIANNIEEIPGVLLYNIDSIRQKANDTLEERKKAIPAVEKIIEDSIEELNSWSKEMEVSPTIHKLKNALEEIRQNELARHLKKMNEKEAELMDTVTKGMMQKIIKLPVLQLKAACQRGEAETLIDVLNDLFDLERQVKKEQ